MNYLLEGESTERILFRKVGKEDFESWLPFYHDPESYRFWEGIPQNPELACHEQFDRIFERYDKGLGGMNALIDKKNGELLGLCGLLVQCVDGEKELEIGYSILPRQRRKGYALEAAIKCMEYAREHKLANSLISIIHIDNFPSQKVALALGMTAGKYTSYKDNPVCIYRLQIGMGSSHPYLF